MEAHPGVKQINLEKKKAHPKGVGLSLEPLRLTLEPWKLILEN
jgi:hypothetical protein